MRNNEQSTIFPVILLKKLISHQEMRVQCCSKETSVVASHANVGRFISFALSHCFQLLELTCYTDHAQALDLSETGFSVCILR